MANNDSAKEQIRIDCLSLASNIPYGSSTTEEIIERAKAYEAYVFGGEEFYGSPGEVVSKAEGIIVGLGLTWETANTIVEALTTSGVVLGLKKPTA